MLTSMWFAVAVVLTLGITRTLHGTQGAALCYVVFDPERKRFELLSPGLRVELEDYQLLDQTVAAATPSKICRA